jgi:hypothetical protein
LKPICDTDKIVSDYFIIHCSNLLIAHSSEFLDSSDFQDYMGLLKELTVSTMESGNKEGKILSWEQILSDFKLDFCKRIGKSYLIKFKDGDALTSDNIKGFCNESLNSMGVSLCRKGKFKDEVHVPLVFRKREKRFDTKMLDSNYDSDTDLESMNQENFD